jgi:DnaJ-class molecular chaperone
MTYYDTLNVQEDSTLKDIKQSYHNLSRRYHPDKNNGDDTMFKKISEAYQVLSDTEERRKYDFQLKPMDTMMFRPKFNININSMFQNMDIIFQTSRGNVSSESVSISTVIENGVKKTKKVTIKDGIKKVEIYEGQHNKLL